MLSRVFGRLLPEIVKIHVWPKLDNISKIVLKATLMRAMPWRIDSDYLEEMGNYSPQFASMFVDIGLCLPRDIAPFAAQYDNIPLLNWAKESQYDLSMVAWRAAECGKVAGLEWAKNNGCLLLDERNYLHLALRSGSIETIKWIMNNRSEKPEFWWAWTVIDIDNRHRDVFLWLLDYFLLALLI